MHFDYVISATNDMFGLLRDEIHPSQRNLAQAAAIGCNTLRRVADDREFIYAVQLLIGRRDEFRQDYETIVGDVEHFTRFFLTLERRILVEHGIEPEVADQITERARSLREAILNWNQDAHMVSHNVRVLGKRVCELAEKLEAQARAQSLFERIKFGVAGVAVIGINAIVVEGFSQAGSAASGGVGGTFISRSIT